MLLGVGLFVLAASAGYGVLRSLRLARGPLAVGLSPAAGLALFPALASWCILVGAPVITASVLIVGASVAGLAMLICDRERLLVELRANARGITPLLAAFGVTALVLSSAAYVQLGVPNYANDAAFHVETLDALRRGAGWAGWYPPGSHVTLAAFLELVPWIDSAAGAAGASLALALAAPLVLFALAWAGFRDLHIAGAAALLAALTFHYPYSPHFWSFWPLAWGTLLALALLAVGLEYTRRPSRELAILGGVVTGGIVLVHGSELYTALVGLVVISIAAWRGLRWRLLGAHLGLAFIVAVALSGAYLPALLGWAGAGGPGDAALAEFGTRTQAANRPIDDEVLFWLNTFTAGIVVDTPVRVALLVAGIWLALRRRAGRVLVCLLVGFYTLVLVLRYVETPLLRQWFERTFPWGLTYRLATAPSALAGIVEGAGCVGVWRVLARTRCRWPGSAARRLSLLTTAAAVLFLAGSAALLARRVAAEAAVYLTYSADDALAMRWLSLHADRDLTLVNDGPEDGGIWAPYKAGLRLLSPRTGASDPKQASLIQAHAAELDTDVQSRIAACAASVGYVYRGVVAVPIARRLPTLEELRQSAALEEVFESGRVAVFRTHLNC